MPASYDYIPPSWSERCKAARIVEAMRNQMRREVVKELIGLKNLSYVSWLEKNRVYSDKKIPRKALQQTFAYYEQHKHEFPFAGITI